MRNPIIPLKMNTTAPLTAKGIADAKKLPELFNGTIPVYGTEQTAPAKQV